MPAKKGATNNDNSPAESTPDTPPPVAEEITDDNTPQEETETIAAAEVLTRGEDFTRQQLERYEPNQPPVSEPVNDHGENLRQIHALNRDALSALARVDAMLNGKDRGGKQ
jgi:hypothetical protein